MNIFKGRDTPYHAHHMFDGDMYVLNSIMSVGAGTTVYIQGKLGANKFFHKVERRHAFESGGPYTIDLIEAPTLTDGTTVVTASNMNRQSTKTHAAQFFSNPTGVSGGTIIDTLYIPASGSGSNTIGTGTLGSERILKKSTDYLIRIANGGGASILYSTVLFYESDN
jgi:hypothetical protein